MRADLRFLAQPKEFWANVRTISQEVGYTERTTKSIKVPPLGVILQKFRKLGLSTVHLAAADNALTQFGQRLFDYFVWVFAEECG